MCHQLSPDLQRQIEDAIALDEPDRVQQLTADYAQLGTDLYDGEKLGFFLDRIDSWEISDSP